MLKFIIFTLLHFHLSLSSPLFLSQMLIIIFCTTPNFFTFTGGDNHIGILNVIDATSKVFTEISGRTDSGIGLNASLIGSYNPVNDLNAPNFKNMSAKGQDEIESDLTLLDAYMTTSIDTAGGGYLDIRAILAFLLTSVLKFSALSRSSITA